jgi:hypothetical protein
MFKEKLLIRSSGKTFIIIEELNERIERDKQEVEVKLNNGMELTFDRSHNLIGIDD